MGLNRITFLLLAALSLFSACSRSEGDAAEIPPLYDNLTVSATAAPSPQPSATMLPTSTPEPTPIVPSIEVNAQTLTEDGRLVIDRVIIPNAGWLVIYQDIDGEAGELLGYERLVPGENLAVTMSIPPREATDSLLAQLHEDAGEIGKFEFPEEDLPLNNGADPVAESFPVEIKLELPLIDVADQDIDFDGLVTVNNVFALVPGWLVIHNLEDGEISDTLGQIPVQPGQNNDLTFSIRWRIAGTDLLAVLYEDAEQPGGFDSMVDLPVLDEGSAVVAEFTVSLPPDVLIYDQPVREGKLIVERVTSDGPGWIVAYHDEEDLPGLIIGSAYVEEGVNELVELEVVETAATQRLFLLMHEDTGRLGEFDFPAADLPLKVEGQPLPPFIMHTSPGNYLITKDQRMGGENNIIVPLVVTDLDSWVVIYNSDEAGEASEIIGQSWLPAGINREVAVAIDPELATDKVLAALHQDNAPIETFDFPGGVDIPLLRNLLPIQSPFILEVAQEAIRPLP